MTKPKRSGHKKSTHGCETCKKRHRKCDETRPSCVNCETIGRRCPYLDEQVNSEILTPTTSSSDGSNFVQSASLTLATASPSTAVAAQLRFPSLSFDLVYVELLQQWLNETHRSFVFKDEHAHIFGPVTLNHALAWPFLMHGILAYSSLHLSTKFPGKSMAYQQYADDLLGKALSEFNTILPKLDATSITAAFVFSSVISAHQMFKCFSAKTDNFEEFMDRFIECLKICRGVNIVIRNWWEVLRESELKPLLTISDDLMAGRDLDKHTSEFDSVRDLIHNFESTNSPDTTATYVSAVQDLQKKFNVQFALDSPQLNQSTSWAFAWPVHISSDLVNLLEVRRPEALVILAHYTPLLHYRRTSWAIGDAGHFTFKLIETLLGPKWAEWLHWPRQVVSVE